MGRVTYLSDADLTLETPHWFWKEASSALVSCTATILFPDGTSDSVTAETGCDVYAPYSAFSADTLSKMCYFSGNVMGTSNPDTIATWDPASGNDACIDFFGNAGAPDRFWVDGHGGVHCYVQLTNTFDFLEYEGPPFFRTYSTGGRFDLDNAFPYPASMQGDFPPHMFWADSVENAGPRPNQYVATDGPSLGFILSSSFRMNETYRMYQLYHPAGGDEHFEWAWVPLNQITWIVQASGRYGFSGDPVPGSRVEQTDAGPTTSHPEWTDVFHNSGSQPQALHLRKRKTLLATTAKSKGNNR